MKRNRSDSAAAAVKAMVNAAKDELQPPPHVKLSDSAAAFWPAITRARARDEWRDVDLVVAAQLAECQALIEQESIALRGEGMIVKNDRGTQIENPRNKVVQTLATREMALMRTLLMGGKASGDPRNWTGARGVEEQSRRIRDEMMDDPLLA